MAQKVYLKKSSVVDKTPSANGLDFGELAINYASGTGKSFLATKKYNGTIAKFHEDAYNEATFASKGDLSLVQSDISEIKPNYVTKAQLSAASGAAVSSAYTMAVNYVNQAVSGLSIGDYLTVASASSVFSEINSQLVEMANSAVVESKISALTKTVEDNEYVVAQAFNDLNDRVDGIDERIGDFSGEFLTVSSASSVFADMGSGIQEAKDKAQSAYTYATIISGSVYSKTQTDSAIATAKNAGVTSAYNASTAVTKTLSGNVESRLNTISQSLSDYVTTGTAQSISGAKTFSTAPTMSAGYNAVATSSFGDSYRTIPFASTASSTNIMYVKPDANTGLMFNPNTGKLRTGGYVINGKTADDLLTANGRTKSVNSFASSGALSSLQEEVSRIDTAVSTMSGAVAGDYATKTEASEYAAAALGNSMSYTDSKVAGLSIGNYLTVASASSKFSTIDQAITNNSNKIDAVSGNVKITYWTSATTQTKINDAKNAAVTSAFTAASAVVKTLSGNVESRLSTLNQSITSVDNKVTGLSAGVKTMLSTVYSYQGSVNNYSDLPSTGHVTGYVYNVVNANGNTPAGTNYAWNGTAWDALGGTIDLSVYATSAVVKSRFDAINEDITGLENSINAVSGNVTNNYATKANASSYAAAALSNAMDYTDSKVAGLSIGSYLTVASATSKFSTIDHSLTTNANNINAVSATVKNAYWTSATTQSKITEAKNAGVTSAFTAASAVVKTLSGNVESRIATFSQSITNLSANTVSAINGVYKVITDNEEVTAAALNELNDDLDNLSSVFETLNGSVTSISNTVKSVTGTVGTLSEDVSTLKSSASTLNDKIARLTVNSGSLQDQITRLNTNSGSLQNQITRLNANSGSLQNQITRLNANSGSLQNQVTRLNTNSGAMNTLLTLINGRYVSAATYSTADTTTSIANNTLKIPKPRALTLKQNAISIGSYDGSEAKTYTFSDSAVVQSNSTATTFRPIILGATSNATPANLTATTTGQVYVNKGIYAQPSTAKIFAAGFQLTGGGTSLLTANGGNVAQSTFAAATRKVNGHALSADVTVTLTDLGIGNVENTKLSTWTGNTSIKSVGTITAGTWNGTNIALNKLAKSAITIDGTSTALGGSVTTKNVLQTSNTEAKRRPLLLGVSSAATGTALATTTQTGQSFFNASIYAIPSTGKLYAAGYALTGGGTNLLTADGGSVAQSTFVAATRKVNGHALSADVTVTKGDLSLGNVENTALSTWTGNTSIKSVGTITAGTWNGTNIALNKLASSAITIDGTATALGGSITTKNVTQANNTGAQYRPLLLGNNNHATAGSIPTATTTSGTVFNIGIYAQPSTKKIFAAGFQLTAGTANVLLGNGSSEARSNFATSSITHAEITAATANAAQKINVTADAATKHYLLGMAATGEMNSTSTHLSSTGVYWENSNLYATSDERLKDFTGDVEVDFDKLKSIPKKYFKWKSKGPQGKTDIGTSAQKVLALYPELVSGSEDSYYGVAYDKLSILALAAIDKLHEENEELRNEIKELKERLRNLEK